MKLANGINNYNSICLFLRKVTVSEIPHYIKCCHLH